MINGVDWGYFGQMIKDAEEVVRSNNIKIPEFIQYDVANITKNWGYWTVDGDLHKIKIAKFLVDSQDDKPLMNTLIHEILHACYPKSGHRGNWKKAADLITSKTDYEISRLANWKEFKEEPKFMFKVTCKGCGKSWYYFKPKPIIRKLVKNKCRCRLCDSKKFIVVNKFGDIIK